MQTTNMDPYEEAKRARKRGNHARVMEILEEQAKEGDEHGLTLLGEAYALGIGVPVDLDKAEGLLKQAAALGSSEAIFTMAEIWRIRGDMKRYFLSIQEAADEGLLIAQFYLGACYQAGRGTAIDTSKADELYRDAADRGLIRAKTFLARRRIRRIYNPVGFVYGMISMFLAIIEGLTIKLIDPADERLR